LLRLPLRPSLDPSSRQFMADDSTGATLAVLPLPVHSATEEQEADLIRLVLDSVTSMHSRRSYEKGLRQFSDGAGSNPGPCSRRRWSAPIAPGCSGRGSPPRPSTCASRPYASWPGRWLTMACLRPTQLPPSNGLPGSSRPGSGQGIGWAGSRPVSC
jgi:hypothetical protein